jgi:hypothetical protein
MADMDTKTFLETVLGDEGSYCVWANRLSDKRHVQKFYNNLESVIHAARTLDEDGYDAYFALGTFTEAGSRDATNVKQLRAFFLDLDCGLTKPYDTQPRALEALRVFCKQVKLPRPTLVNSGRGVHVYWSLIAPVSRELWLPVAKQLKALCKQHGLYADPVVTADAARILRIPGTHNYKDVPPAEVLIVGHPAAAVDFAAFAALVGAPAGEVVQDTPDVFKSAVRYAIPERDSFMQALTGSVTSRFKTIMMKTVNGSGCAQLGEIVLNQENVDEPLWRAGLSVAKFCVDGGKAVHKISERHPEYSADATEYKVSTIRGPYLCKRFDEYRQGVCPECRHWNKIKSPISLGREIAEAEDDDNIVVQPPAAGSTTTPVQYEIPKYPMPYFRGKAGGVFRHAKDDEGNPTDALVYFNDLYVVRRLKDLELGEALVMRLHLPKDGVREFTVPLTAVGTKDDFRKHLAMQGVAVLNVTELMEYTMRWVNELQFKVEAEEAQRQFGWVDDSGTAFAAGDVIVRKDRVEVNAPSGATVGLFPHFQSKGTLEGWKETMRFYDRDGMEAHQFMLGLQFGAQLMEFQSINAAAFHMYSKESGLGKTTGMLAGASVWGNPDLLMLQERDTFNSKMNRAEVYKSLAVYMDEMTNTKPQDLSDWLYQMPSGLQRNRMGSKANTERARGKPWKTLFGTTGNTSMLERISLYKALPKAEAQRVLEHRVERVKFTTKHETDQFAIDIKENYGHAGIVYVQYIMNNLEAAKALANAVQCKIDVEAKLTAENRFWSALVSRTLAGLMLAKRAGLIDWKIEPVAKWAVGVMRVAHTVVHEMNTDVESILTDYLAENYNSMLRIKSTDDARKQPVGLDHLITPEAAPRGNMFVARYEYDVKKLYLLPKPLKEWCGKQQINYAGFVEGVRDGRTKAVKVKMRLARGTHMNFPPVDVLALDCSGFLDDAVEQTMATTATLFKTQTA